MILANLYEAINPPIGKELLDSLQAVAQTVDGNYLEWRLFDYGNLSTEVFDMAIYGAIRHVAILRLNGGQ